MGRSRRYPDKQRKPPKRKSNQKNTLTRHRKVTGWNQTSDLLAMRSYLLQHCGSPPIWVCRLVKATRAFKFMEVSGKCVKPSFIDFLRNTSSKCIPWHSLTSSQTPAISHCQNVHTHPHLHCHCFQTVKKVHWVELTL